MPIDGVLDLQRRSAPLGEIRIGSSVQVPGKKGRQPKRSDTFIFTTDLFAAQVVAAKYGGAVAPWDRRKGRYAVTTDRDVLHVWVPPRGLAVDANMELWDTRRCLRKCTGTRMLFPQPGPCLCPQPEDPSDEAIQRARDERKRLAAMVPPKACKPRTLINVSITDLPGLTGVWRLSTGSENAAVEIPDQGDALAIAREAGAYLPAIVRIDWRFRALDGSPYPVLSLRIGMSAEELARGELPAGPRGLLSQLQAGTPERLAITGGESVPASREEHPAAVRQEQPATAQEIADRAPLCTTRKGIECLFAEADKHRVAEDMVCADRDNDVYQELRPYLQDCWRNLPAEGEADA